MISISDGMIGAEMVKKDDYQKKLSELDDLMHPAESHDEYGVVDNKGRIKIPEEYIWNMNLQGGERVKIRKSANGLEIYKEQNKTSDLSGQYAILEC